MLIRTVIHLCLLLATLSAHAFESELWPGEGIPRFAARVDHLTLYQEPGKSASVLVKHPVQVGEEVTYDEIRFRTLQSGQISARRAGTFLARNFGDIAYLSKEIYYSSAGGWEKISYEAGDSFQYLQYRSEGSCFIRHDSEILEIDWCSWVGISQTNGFDVTKRPVTEFWIRVVYNEEPLKGWLLVDGKSVEMLPRQF